MDLFSYTSGKVSGIIGDSPSPMHYREKYHRGAPDIPEEIGDYRGRSPDTFPFPAASVGDNLKNKTAPNPAQALKTRNDRRAAFAAWEAECQRYDAEGRQDELPPLPVVYVSQGMARLQRQTREPRKWR